MSFSCITLVGRWLFPLLLLLLLIFLSGLFCFQSRDHSHQQHSPTAKSLNKSTKKRFWGWRRFVRPRKSLIVGHRIQHQVKVPRKVILNQDWSSDVMVTYRKIPKISPGAYIFQWTFLRGLFLEGLIFGGAYVRTEICVSKLIKLAYSGKEIHHFCFVLLCIRGKIPSTSPRGAYIRRGDLTEGFCVTILGGLYIEGLIHGGAYFPNFTVFWKKERLEIWVSQNLVRLGGECPLNARNGKEYTP